MNPLKLSDLRIANAARQKEWDPGAKISLVYRGNEMAGEVGEACNELKKLERERLGIKGSRTTVEKAAEELADVVICADLCALDLGIDLGDAVEAKFNATSTKVGLAARLSSGLDPDDMRTSCSNCEAELDENSNVMCWDCGCFPDKLLSKLLRAIDPKIAEEFDGGDVDQSALTDRAIEKIKPQPAMHLPAQSAEQRVHLTDALTRVNLLHKMGILADETAADLRDPIMAAMRLVPTPEGR